MKKVFLTLVFLVILTAVFAQIMNEMVVVKQAVIRPDQLINHARKDRMGRVCAGLMIYTDLTGLSFDSNNGVVDLTQQPGSYMVFVSEGERVLYIYKEGFKPLEIILYQYGISGLKSGQVYQIDVTAKDMEASKTLPVVFNVTPADAVIRVGSKMFVSGQAKSLPLGDNEVVIEKEGYRSIKDNIKVSSTNIQFNYTLQKTEPVLVKIRTNPADTIIYINNAERGNSPDLWLFPGMYELKINKSQYLTVDEVITISENKENEFSYNLTKNTGVVNFTLNPANAQVFVNRELASNNTRLELVPGVYMIEIKADKHHSQTEAIEVKLGDNIYKNYTLQAMQGTLLLTANPVDTKTELYLDNKLIRTVTGSARVSDLFVGEYVLKCSVSGYKSKDFKVSIIENEAKEFNIILDKGPDVPEGMVYVEGGTFQMGSNSGESDEKPVHSVTVSSFYIGKYEVTQKQWTEVMGSNPSHFQGDNLPVEDISWYQAVEFCNKLSQKEGLTPAYTINGRNVTCNWNANGYRLPTEAEWEYAARGGNKAKKRFFGGYKNNYSGSNNIDEVAWYSSNSGSKTQAVGTKKANELGIYDMSGNVWEWCWDWYGSYSSGAKTNPRGSSSGSRRVLRGGSWLYYAKYCRSAYRRNSSPDDSNLNRGFRLLRSSE